MSAICGFPVSGATRLMWPESTRPLRRCQARTRSSLTCAIIAGVVRTLSAISRPTSLPSRPHLTDTESRGEPVRERWTYEDVPGERYLDRPVLVLTNGRTFSAAESFTFGLKVTDRVLTVGERTGGGGHFGGVGDLTGDFTIFVPVGRTFDPRTWRGLGSGRHRAGCSG